MSELLENERETMSWAAEAFKQPWLKLIDVWSRMEKGENIPGSQAVIQSPVLPFELNAALFYHLMRSGAGRIFFGRRGDQFTIVTNETWDRVIWAGVDREQDGVFVEHFEFRGRLELEWARETARLIAAGKLSEAFSYLRSWINSQHQEAHLEPKSMKVLNIRFFNALRRAYKPGEKFPGAGFKTLEAVGEIIENGWIMFYPPNKAESLIRKTITHPLMKFIKPLKKISVRNDSV